MEKCFKLLKSSKSDNETFAALLLIAKCIKSENLDKDDRRKVFDAVGFNFINRLIQTDTLPEGCEHNIYRSLALTLLACFSTDQNLVDHPQFCNKLPFFIRVISDGGASEGEVDDALDCLTAQLGGTTNKEELLKHSAMEVLAEQCVKQLTGSTRCVSLLAQVSSLEWSEESRDLFWEHFNAAVNMLSAAYKSQQDALKFKVQDSISCLFSNVTCSFPSSPQIWLNDIAQGLRDVLQSKVRTEDRNTAFKLASLLAQQFGLNWTVEVMTRGKQVSLLSLLAELVSVEVHLGLDEEDLQKVLSRSELLSCCFSLMESCVVFSSSLADTAEPSLSELLLSLHSSLMEAMKYILQFLYRIKEEAPAQLMRKPLVLGAIRVLGAWLAEESIALSEDIYGVLPFLLTLSVTHINEVHISERSQQDGGLWSGGDVIKFLLPGLCHLTAEDKPRAILLQNNLPKILQHHFSDLYERHQSGTDSDLIGQLSMCVSVYQNICVCEPDLVSKDDTFLLILETVISCLHCKKFHLYQYCNFVFLALLIIRRKGSFSSVAISKCEIFVDRVVNVILESLKLFSSDKEWQEVSEISLLILQEMESIYQKDCHFSDCITNSKFPSQIKQFFKSLPPLPGTGSADDLKLILKKFIKS